MDGWVDVMDVLGLEIWVSDLERFLLVGFKTQNLKLAHKINSDNELITCTDFF